MRHSASVSEVTGACEPMLSAHQWVPLAFLMFIVQKMLKKSVNIAGLIVCLF